MGGSFLQKRKNVSVTCLGVLWSYCRGPQGSKTVVRWVVDISGLKTGCILEARASSKGEKNISSISSSFLRGVLVCYSAARVTEQGSKDSGRRAEGVSHAFQ